MKRIVKVVYSSMYQNTNNVSYYEKLLVSFSTIVVIVLSILITLAHSN